MNTSATLTKRESQIAELIAWGSTKKDIANLLFISPRTVENTARSIYEKTDVSKANELSAWWFCTHYNISLNLSPLKRSLVALLFLIIFLPYELSSHQETLRSIRGRLTEARTREAARTREDYILEF